MKIMKINNRHICAPHAPILGEMLASITKEWIAIGSIADGHGMLVDSMEWPEFVKFVNEIDVLISTFD